MSGDRSAVEPAGVPDLVRQIVADVLMVPLEQVSDGSALVRDLGAESIDFLDLVFRLEEVLAKPITPDRWQRFVAQRFVGADLSTAITTGVVVEFALLELGRS